MFESTTSEYLLLFRGTSWHQDLSPEEIRGKMDKFVEWFDTLKDAGKFKSGHPLSHSGKIIADRGAVTDGPFAESKEAIAGFFIIEAESLEEAVEWAQGCPSLKYGQTVEVRPIIFDADELRIAAARENG